MRYLELCDKYFLMLILINSFILIKIDGDNFIKIGNKKQQRNVKVIGYLMIIISVILFGLRMFLIH